MSSWVRCCQVLTSLAWPGYPVLYHHVSHIWSECSHRLVTSIYLQLSIYGLEGFEENWQYKCHPRFRQTTADGSNWQPTRPTRANLLFHERHKPPLSTNPAVAALLLARIPKRLRYLHSDLLEELLQSASAQAGGRNLISKSKSRISDASLYRGMYLAPSA